MYQIIYIWKDDTDDGVFIPVNQKFEQVAEIAQHVYEQFKEDMAGYRIEKVS